MHAWRRLGCLGIGRAPFLLDKNKLAIFFYGREKALVDTRGVGSCPMQTPDCSRRNELEGSWGRATLTARMARRQIDPAPPTDLCLGEYWTDPGRVPTGRVFTGSALAGQRLAWAWGFIGLDQLAASRGDKWYVRVYQCPRQVTGKWPGGLLGFDLIKSALSYIL